MLWFLCFMIVAGILGMTVAGIFIGALFLPPLYRWQAAKNGAPFKVGDEVIILTGTNRGRVARVYEVWPERWQVRVKLGDKERREVTDVFSAVEISRQSSTQQLGPTADRSI